MSTLEVSVAEYVGSKVGGAWVSVGGKVDGVVWVSALEVRLVG